MPTEVVDSELRIKREAGDKTSILQRLARIEGQVRGLRQMVEGNRGTVEQIQQLNAVIAALREVALLSISQEIRRQVATMSGNGADAGEVQQLVELLRSTFRLV